MKLSHFKNIILTLLVISCFALTFRLWFGSFSPAAVRVATAHPDPAIDVPALTEIMIRPARIITTAHESNRFIITYADIDTAPEFILGQHVVADVLNRGGFAGSTAMDSSELAALFAGDIISFEYNFPMPSDVFGNFFDQRANLLSSNVSNFDTLVMSVEGSLLNVAFFNRNQGMVHKFYVENDAMAAALAYLIMQTESPPLLYRMSLICFPFIFDNITFIPDWQGDFVYHPIYRQIPYSHLDLRIIERFVAFLFPNPNAIISSRINNVFTYRDSFRTVMFYPSNVLVYNTTNRRTPDTAVNFTSSYLAALNMIERDRASMEALGAAMNQVFMSGYRHIPGSDEWIFFFDYISNNLPIRFSEEFAQEIVLANGIEVRVRENTVVHYRRLLLNFTPDFYEEPEIANRTFENVLPTLHTHDGITSANLQFRITADGHSILHWRIDPLGVARTISVFDDPMEVYYEYQLR